MTTDVQLNRLERLEGAVNLLLERLGDGVQGPSIRSPTPARTPIPVEPQQRSRGVSLDEDAIAPVLILRDLAAESGTAVALSSGINGQQFSYGADDIIQAGVVSLTDATILMRM